MKWLMPLVLISSLCAAEMEPKLKLEPFISKRAEPQILFNNRPLAKVVGKTISLMDVVKKMDVFLHQYYPQAFDSKSALYQFYTNNWWSTLDEMINNELILQEAAEREIKASDGDVREEMEERFGPNIMSKLSQLGLAYEEARQMIHDEIVVRQMSYLRIHSKAIQEVTPSVIKEKYVTYSHDHPNQEEWTYQMLSIRGSTPFLSEKISQRAEEILTAGVSSLKDAADQLQNEFQEVKISLSNDIVLEDRGLSKANRSILSSLATGEFSTPTLQKSAREKEPVLRIFHLKDHRDNPSKSFDEMATPLKDELMRSVVDKHHKQYVTKLRVKYHFDDAEMKENIPADYQPFLLHG